MMVAAVLLLACCTPPREKPHEVVIWHQKTGAERAFLEEVVKADNPPAEKFALLRRVLDDLTGEEVQVAMAARLFTRPSAPLCPRLSGRPPQYHVLPLAIEQAKYSLPMPVDSRLRFLWDGRRGPYRRVFTENLSPDEAARLMPREAERRITEGLR